MVNFPNAKINLGLYVTAKRTDGYHDIISCFYPIPWKEALEVIPSVAFSFTTSGMSIPGNTNNNLAVKAYQLLQKTHNLPPVAMHLHKTLPMGAGLGGGSSDAAHALLLLNRLFDLNLSIDQLITYSSQLGSDCAFFILNKPCIAKGKGEILNTISLSLKNHYLMMVHPGIHISTQEAYAGIKPKALHQNLEDLLMQSPAQWKGKLLNQFEEHLFLQFPELASIKEKLYGLGALYASMSGSGSAMYGIFTAPPQPSDWPAHYQTTVLKLE